MGNTPDAKVNQSLNGKSGCFRWCWKSFCVIFFCRKHLYRDLIMIGFLIISLGSFLGIGAYSRNKTWTKNQKTSRLDIQPAEKMAIEKEEKRMRGSRAIMDAASWKQYGSDWYGFSIKYPSNWPAPKSIKPSAYDKWDYKISFERERDPDNPFSGFEVRVYSVAKIKEVANVNEFPQIKNQSFISAVDCGQIKGHILETGDYPAEEIYIPRNDACYQSALFFSNTRDNYIYTIAPIIKEGVELSNDPAEEMDKYLPEFFAAAKSWNLIDIKRPKPAPRKPVISAPKPLSYDVVGGKLVCAKKNDKPSKSNQNKGRHMDMECCLDPDEYPNPHCTYSQGKYKKYL